MSIVFQELLVNVYINSKEADIIVSEVITETFDNITTNEQNEVCFEQEIIYMMINLSDFIIENNFMESAEVEEILNCEINEYISENDTLIPILLKNSSTYFNNLNESEFINKSEICLDLKLIVPLNGFLSYDLFKKKCSNIGGRLLRENELTTFEPLIEKLKTRCPSDDDKISWVSSIVNEGENNLKDLCKVLLGNDSVIFHACISELSCGFCLVPYGMQIKFFGDINNYDRNYTLIADETGYPYLEGTETSLVRFNGSDWLLESTFHSNKWILQTKLFPTGRQKWTSLKKNEELEFTFTTCNLNAFACNDNQCIDLCTLCDGVVDCNDNSDEENCKTISKSPGYKTKINPPPLIDDERVKMQFNVVLNSVADISTKIGVASLDLTFLFVWHDPRVTIWNIHYEMEIDCDEIWFPIIRIADGYPNGHSIGTPTIYLKKCLVGPPTGPMEQSIHDAYMGKYFLFDSDKISCLLNNQKNTLIVIFFALNVHFILQDKSWRHERQGGLTTVSYANLTYKPPYTV